MIEVPTERFNFVVAERPAAGQQPDVPGGRPPSQHHPGVRRPVRHGSQQEAGSLRAEPGRLEGCQHTQA